MTARFEYEGQGGSLVRAINAIGRFLYSGKNAPDLVVDADQSELTIFHVDAANVGMMKAHVPRADADHVSVQKEQNTGRDGKLVMPANVVQFLRNDASVNDPLSVEYDGETWTITSGGETETFNGLSLDEIRKPRELPDLDLPVETTINADDLKTVVRLVEDHVSDYIQLGAIDGEAFLHAEGDIADLHAVPPQETDGRETVASLFGMNYFYDLVYGVPSPQSTDVTLRVGTEFPLEVEYPLYQSDSGYVEAGIAPRISSDGIDPATGFEATPDPAVAIDAMPDNLARTFAPMQMWNHQSEAKIHIGPDGLETAVADAANVGMQHVAASPDAFEDYRLNFDTEGDGLEIGANTERLYEITDSLPDEPATLEIDPKTRKFSLKAGWLTYLDGLIDPDAIRRQPTTMDAIDFTGEIQTTTDEWFDLPNEVDDSDMAVTLGAADGTGYRYWETATGELDDDDDPPEPDDYDHTVVIRDESTEDKEQYRIGHIQTFDGRGGMFSRYSGDYLADLDVYPWYDKPDSRMLVSTGVERPVVARWRDLDDELQVHAMIAPRITDDGGYDIGALERNTYEQAGLDADALEALADGNDTDRDALYTAESIYPESPVEKHDPASLSDLTADATSEDAEGEPDDTETEPDDAGAGLDGYAALDIYDALADMAAETAADDPLDMKRQDRQDAAERMAAEVDHLTEDSAWRVVTAYSPKGHGDSAYERTVDYIGTLFAKNSRLDAKHELTEFKGIGTGIAEAIQDEYIRPPGSGDDPYPDYPDVELPKNVAGYELADAELDHRTGFDYAEWEGQNGGTRPAVLPTDGDHTTRVRVMSHGGKVHANKWSVDVNYIADGERRSTRLTTRNNPDAAKSRADALERAVEWMQDHPADGHHAEQEYPDEVGAFSEMNVTSPDTAVKWATDHGLHIIVRVAKEPDYREDEIDWSVHADIEGSTELIGTYETKADAIRGAVEWMDAEAWHSKESDNGLPVWDATPADNDDGYYKWSYPVPANTHTKGYTLVVTETADDGWEFRLVNQGSGNKRGGGGIVTRLDGLTKSQAFEIVAAYQRGDSDVVRWWLRKARGDDPTTSDPPQSSGNSDETWNFSDEPPTDFDRTVFGDHVLWERRRNGLITRVMVGETGNGNWRVRTHESEWATPAQTRRDWAKENHSPSGGYPDRTEALKHAYSLLLKYSDDPDDDAGQPPAETGDDSDAAESADSESVVEALADAAGIPRNRAEIVLNYLQNTDVDAVRGRERYDAIDSLDAVAVALVGRDRDDLKSLHNIGPKTAFTLQEWADAHATEHDLIPLAPEAKKRTDDAGSSVEDTDAQTSDRDPEDTETTTSTTMTETAYSDPHTDDDGNDHPGVPYKKGPGGKMQPYIPKGYPNGGQFASVEEVQRVIGTDQPDEMDDANDRGEYPEKYTNYGDYQPYDPTSGRFIEQRSHKSDRIELVDMGSHRQPYDHNKKQFISYEEAERRGFTPDADAAEQTTVTDGNGHRISFVEGRWGNLQPYDHGKGQYITWADAKDRGIERRFGRMAENATHYDTATSLFDRGGSSADSGSSQPRDSKGRFAPSGSGSATATDGGTYDAVEDMATDGGKDDDENRRNLWDQMLGRDRDAEGKPTITRAEFENRKAAIKSATYGTLSEDDFNIKEPDDRPSSREFGPAGFEEDMSGRWDPNHEHWAQGGPFQHNNNTLDYLGGEGEASPETKRKVRQANDPVGFYMAKVDQLKEKTGMTEQQVKSFLGSPDKVWERHKKSQTSDPVSDDHPPDSSRNYNSAKEEYLLENDAADSYEEYAAETKGKPVPPSDDDEAAANGSGRRFPGVPNFDDEEMDEFLNF